MTLDRLTPEHRREYVDNGRISSPDFVLHPKTDILDFPQNPFDYAGLLAGGAIGTVPAAAVDTEVAVVGAGVSGLCAAYELMKVGLRPVVYEVTGRVGGRTWSKPTGDPNLVLEMGAMRVPTTHLTFQFYRKQFGIETAPFPNPGTVDTMLCFEDQRDVWEPGKPKPEYLGDVLGKLGGFFAPKLGDLGGAKDPGKALSRWEYWVDRYKDVGFLEALLAEDRWSSKELAVVGALGAGTGGLEAQLRVSFLELLRAAIGGWDTGDELVTGGPHGAGIQSLADSFWSAVAPTASGETTLRALHGETGDQPARFSPAVVALRPAPPGKSVEVVDASGASRTFPAVILTCTTRAAEMGIRIDESLFSKRVWRAMRRIHYMDASRILCRSSTKFWKEAGSKVCPVTLTDRPTRATYLLDYPNTESGACLLSYTWGDDSTKFLALSDLEKLTVCLDTLDEIYGGAFPKVGLSDFEAISWQSERGYNGGFKLCYPGQYEDNRALFNQYKEPLDPDGGPGVFLAGEGVSWAGGWIEGALQSGLNAAFGVVRLLGGSLGDSAPAAASPDRR